MIDFPQSAQATKELAIKLVRHLKNGIGNTDGPRGVWKSRNFALLDGFCREEGIDPIYSGENTGPECLWDFMGYISGKGPVISAESEFETCRKEIAHDFDKLLYGSSPIKLMICRIDKRTSPEASEEAYSIRECLDLHIKGNCAHYPPGSVFILYCIWWAEEGGPNRDFPFILQVDGDPHYVCVRQNQQFEQVSIRHWES